MEKRRLGMRSWWRSLEPKNLRTDRILEVEEDSTGSDSGTEIAALGFQSCFPSAVSHSLASLQEENIFFFVLLSDRAACAVPG